MSEHFLIMERAEWTERAACRNHDTDLFFIPGEGNPRGPVVTYAPSTIAICMACPVRKECLTYAINSNERFGLWGGKTPKQRRAIRRQLDLPAETPPTRSAECGTNAGYHAHKRRGEEACWSCKDVHSRRQQTVRPSRTGLRLVRPIAS